MSVRLSVCISAAPTGWMSKKFCNFVYSFEKVAFLDTWLSKLGPIVCPEMSIRNYHYLVHNSPEERSVPVWKNSCAHTHTHTHTHTHSRGHTVSLTNTARRHDIRGQGNMKFKKGKQCNLNVTMGCLRITIVVMEAQKLFPFVLLLTSMYISTIQHLSCVLCRHLMCICCILCVFVVPYMYLLYLTCICCTMCVLLFLL